jgi:hypothetical protein
VDAEGGVTRSRDARMASTCGLPIGATLGTAGTQRR